MKSYVELRQAWERWLDDPGPKTLATWNEAQADTCVKDLCILLGYAAAHITTLRVRLGKAVAGEIASKCNGSGTSKTPKTGGGEPCTTTK